MIEPLRNGILFTFVDGVSGGYFVEKTDWGFQLNAGDHESSSQNGRWAKVLARGPEVPDDIKNGAYIFIEPLMWTDGFEFDGVKVWRTNADKVMLVSDNM